MTPHYLQNNIKLLSVASRSCIIWSCQRSIQTAGFAICLNIFLVSRGPFFIFCPLPGKFVLSFPSDKNFSEETA
jgi:hypothetical protein